MWLSTSQKSENPKVTEAEKQQVEAACQAFIENKKPQWIQPPNERWGYVSDVYGKWYRNYYYFCATYRCDDPTAIVPEREVKFTRLEYAGSNKFHMAYFRHTGQ